MMGITEFTAIINLPQAAILAIGGTVPVMKADLTFDQVLVKRITQYRIEMSSVKIGYIHILHG